MRKQCIKQRLREEIDRQREYGFSGKGLLADSLIAIEMLEQASSKPVPNDQDDKPLVKSKAIYHRDIIDQLRLMGWACTLQITNKEWSAHPYQVAKRAENEIRRLRHDLKLLEKRSGGCHCGITGYTPGEEPRGPDVDMGTGAEKEATGWDGGDLC